MVALLSAGVLALSMLGTPSEPPSPSAERPPPVEAEPLRPPAPLEIPPAVRPPDTGIEEVEVRLLIRIDTRGVVTQARVLESGGAALDEAALAAADEFRFEPAREGDTPIEVEVEYLYVFPAVEPPEPEPPSPEDAIDDTEVVRAPPVLEDAAQTELSAETGDRIAGAQGDALKATSALAGVARPAAGRGELVIWGASPSESRRTIDEIPVPRLFHLGGSRSVLPTPMLDSVALVPGGFSASHGRAIGGYVQARTRDARPPGDPRRVGASARIDPIDVGATADARLTDRAWLALGLRRSLLAQTYGPFVPASAQLLVPLPTYWDYQAKSVVRLSERDSITLLGFGAHDRIERGIPSLTPDSVFTEERTSAFHRGGLRFDRLHDDGRSVMLLVWAGRDDERWVQRFAPEVALSDQRAWRGGLRLEERRRLARMLTLRWGLDAELDHHRTERRGALTLPAREGDIVVFGLPPGDRVGRDTWTVIQAQIAAYSSLRLELADGRWAIEPGLRVEPMLTLGDRILPVRPIEPEVGHTDVALAMDPRGRIQWTPHEAVSLFAAGGRYQQAADPIDQSPIFGTPRLPPARAWHAVLGTKTSPTRWLDLDLTGFFIHSRQRAGRNPDPTPAVATALLAQGQGRSYGGQLTARVTPLESLQAGVTYTWMTAERRDPEVAPWRPFDFDQRHGLQALASWAHRSGVELGGRLAFSTGYPRTPVVGAIPNGRTGGFEPVFGEHNTQRLPPVVALSLRVGWGRTWRWGALRTWLDVLNATNRENVEEIFYASDFSTSGAVTGLPVVPSLGLEIRR